SLLYILSFEAVSVVIPGAKTVVQLEDNAAAGDLNPLTDNEIVTIKKAVE
ncbi:MAG: aldo/keto reductase, partial [Spirochaetaceae bacterium]|nr:aldo/keto reductase [Spirochaetaceae bacterium]